jgi:hypothetical protein
LKFEISLRTPLSPLHFSGAATSINEAKLTNIARWFYRQPFIPTYCRRDMPRKSTNKRQMPAESHEEVHDEPQQQPAGDGGMPQIDVNVSSGGVDIMAQMSSPTGIQSSHSHEQNPDTPGAEGHHHEHHHHRNKHGKFEDAQPHGHDLRHHHGYDLRVHVTK